MNRFEATWEDCETLSMRLLPQRRETRDTKVSLKGKGSIPLILVMRCCILLIPKNFLKARFPQTVPQKRREPGYASLLDTRRPDPGYETVTGRGEKRRTSSYGPRSFPPDDYESVHPKEPGYETLEEGRREDYRSLEPGYEVLPDVRGNGMEVQYSRVNKKGGRAAPKHPSPPRSRHYSGSEVNYETLPEPQARGGLSDEGGYETIPANERDQRGWDPGYETLPAIRHNPNRNPPSEPGYETIPAARGEDDAASEAATTDPDYARLKDADIEYIDESGDEVDDEIGRLQAGNSIKSQNQIHQSQLSRRGRHCGVEPEQFIDSHVGGGVRPRRETLLGCRDRARRHDPRAEQGQ